MTHETPADLSSQELRRLHRERWRILRRLENWLETPMVFLGLLWLILLVIEMVQGLSPWIETLATAIWIVFILDFLGRLILAPKKWLYLERNWLTAGALVVPALRIFRIFRALRVLRMARAARGVRLVRVISSLNRGMRALGKAMGRRGLGYMIALTILVLLGGAAGMLAFESESPGGPSDYGSALWWTAMIITTMGSEFWPKTAEGRFLCLLLALYAFTVFGYLTATLASFFVETDQSRKGSTPSLAGLENELQRLNQKIDAALKKSSS